MLNSTPCAAVHLDPEVSNGDTKQENHQTQDVYSGLNLSDQPSRCSSQASTARTCQDGLGEPVPMNHILSRLTSQVSAIPGPPPDGGLRAWMCVLGTHLVVMNTWGVSNSFGTFQSYYIKTLDRSASDIAWIGSFQTFLLLFVGTIAGRLTDAGLFRPVATAGAILILLGTFCTSVSTTYWQTFLAQGISTGLGNGLLFCPAVATVSTYFQKRRSLAIGITACGTTTGGVMFPAIVRELLPRIGLGWTMRVIGLIQFITLAMALLLVKPRLPPRKTGRWVEWEAFKALEYTFYALGGFMCFWATFIAFFFTAAYARDTQNMAFTTSLNLLMVMNGVAIIGRLLPPYLADGVGSLTVFIPTAGAGALLLFCWIAVDSPAGMYVWAAMSGIALGGVQALFQTALASLTSDPSKQGTRIGMVFTIVSFALLSGPPIAGALLSPMKGQYIGAQVFAGSSLILGTAFIAVSREVKRRKKGQKMWSKI